MRTGKTIEQIAIELQQNQKVAHDYVAPLGRLTMETLENTPLLRMDGEKDPLYFTPTSWASGQISTYTGIPKPYFDKIHNENVDLITRMINHGLDTIQKTKDDPSRMIRTVGDNLVALLSPRYRRLDCYDLLDAVLPMFVDHNLKITSCNLSMTKLYIKACSERLVQDIKVGDPVQYGLCISGSDVGCGSIRVEPFLLRIRCLNGWISSIALRKYHIGKQIGGDDNNEIFSDETKDHADKAFWGACRDTVAHSLKHEVFQSEVDKIKIASGMEIKRHPQKVVELTAKEVGITNEETKNSIVSYLANGADGAGFNKHGLAQSFSYAGQSEEISYDAATELERAAGKIYEIPDDLWQKVAG